MGGEHGTPALEQADAAYARGDISALVAHLSASIREFTASGEPCRAAMACVRLGDVLANTLGNLTAARAWFARARRLVDGQPPCLEQGWVAVAALGCEVDDPAELLAGAELALDRARRFGDVNLEAKALADAGLAHVQSGRVSQGMAMLDEAMALACGPVDDESAAAKSACSFFTACFVAGDYERVGSWSGLLGDRGLLSHTSPPAAFVSSHCDSVRAALLVEMGRWGEAEDVLTAAKAAFEHVTGTPSWHPDIGLAELRLRQGRLADAELLLIGKDQSLAALLPMARLHLARGDHQLARVEARRGLRAIGDDRLRSVELLSVLLDAELAAGDLAAADAVGAELAERVAGVEAVTLRTNAASARARALAARGETAGAIELLETALDELDAARLGWLRVSVLLELARLREGSGDAAGARVDAAAAEAALARLDVVLSAEQSSLLARLASPRPAAASEAVAELGRDGKWWIVSCDGVRVRLPDTKGLRYLAELVSTPGVERHALDLVDRVEGVTSGGVDRRALGDAGALLDGRARAAYRHRIEALRAEADEALESGMLERAEAAQEELDQLVRQLAAAFGLGGRDRRAASAAERARLNVTRAVRAAIARLRDAMPGAGEVLDRRVRTGTYCVYAPVDGERRWIVQSRLNDQARD